MTWFLNNIGTIIVSAILLAAIALIVRSMRKDKVQGKSSCGGNCAHCGAQCHSCHPKGQ